MQYRLYTIYRLKVEIFMQKILIGGIGLERGYIQGLTISYVVRESGTDDTVYQRNRFFGYTNRILDLLECI